MVRLDIAQRKTYKRKWKNKIRALGTNAQWGNELLRAIANELNNRDYPDVNYIRKKMNALDRFLDDVELAMGK